MNFSLVALIAALVAGQLIFVSNVKARHKCNKKRECKCPCEEKEQQQSISPSPIPRTELTSTTPAQPTKCAGAELPEYNNTIIYDLPRIYV